MDHRLIFADPSHSPVLEGSSLQSVPGQGEGPGDSHIPAGQEGMAKVRSAWLPVILEHVNRWGGMPWHTNKRHLPVYSQSSGTNDSSFEIFKFLFLP